MNRFGFEESEWEAAKAEGKAILSRYAEQGKTLTYTDFARELHLIQLDPHELRLAELLGEISKEEVKAGRGMLSALVRHHADGWPGRGFFELARELGHVIKDDEEFWIEELNRVYNSWAKQK